MNMQNKKLISIIIIAILSLLIIFTVYELKYKSTTTSTEQPSPEENNPPEQPQTEESQPSKETPSEENPSEQQKEGEGGTTNEQPSTEGNPSEGNPSEQQTPSENPSETPEQPQPENPPTAPEQPQPEYPQAPEQPQPEYPQTPEQPQYPQTPEQPQPEFPQAPEQPQFPPGPEQPGFPQNPPGLQPQPLPPNVLPGIPVTPPPVIIPPPPPPVIIPGRPQPTPPLPPIPKPPKPKPPGPNVPPTTQPTQPAQPGPNVPPTTKPPTSTQPPQPAKITMPNVQGMNATQAVNKLSGIKLKASTTLGDPAPNPKLANTVQSQKPQAGSKVNVGDNAVLKIYGEYILAVPNVVSMPKAEAIKQLSNLNLKVNIVEGSAAPSDRLSNKVQSQTPTPGTKIKPGSSVTLQIYKPPMVSIPNVIGKNANDAAKGLTNLGLSVAANPGDPAPKPQLANTVQAQTPTAGASVQPGTKVVLKVYGTYKPPTVSMPSVIGFRFNDAIRQLSSLGLSVTTSSGDKAPNAQAPNTVESQTPAPGTPVKPGDRVVLKLWGSYQPTTRVPSVVGLPEQTAKQSLYNMHLQVNESSAGYAPSQDRAFKVAGQSPQPNTELPYNSIVNIQTYGNYAFQMPGVIGLSGTDGMNRLASYGLQVSSADAGMPPSVRQSGTIASQSPAPGSLVQRGSVVTVRIYRTRTK